MAFVLADRLQRSWHGVLPMKEAHGRARDREHRIWRTGIASGLSTFVFAAVGIVSLPLTVRYLGSERYGLWVAILSWLSIAGLADLGIGNALVAYLADMSGRDDRQRARELVSTACLVLGLAAIALDAAVLLAAPQIDWARAFNVAGAALGDEAAHAATLALLLFFSSVPFSAVERIFFALQDGHVPAYASIVSSLLGLAAIAAVAQLRLGLPYLVAGVLGTRMLVSLALAVYLFGIRHRWLRPGLDGVRRELVRPLLATGGLYIVANLGLLAQLQAPFLVGPHAVGLAELGRFGVAQRLFGMATSITLMFLGPLWPAYGEALGRGDLAWVRATLRRSYWLGLALAATAGVGLTVLGEWVIRAWIDPRLVVGLPLLAVLAGWLLTRSWQEIHSMFLNGAGQIRRVAVYGIFSALASLALCSVLGRQLGAVGLALGWVVGFVLVSGWLLPFDVQRTLRARALEFRGAAPAVSSPASADAG